MDQLSECFMNISPYVYCLGLPMLFVDADGRAVTKIDGGYSITGDDIIRYWGNVEYLLNGQTPFDNFWYALEKAASSENERFLNLAENSDVFGCKKINQDKSLKQAWDWAKEHFYVGVEGDISYGVQISGKISKTLGFNVNILSETLVDTKLSNKDNYFKTYELVPLNSIDRGKSMDIGISYIGGGNYNNNIENGKVVSQTISGGIIGLGVTYTNGRKRNLFVGYELGGKFAFGYGVSGAFKLGFDIDL